MISPLAQDIHIYLPSEIIYQIRDYLWGTTEDWKRKLNITKGLTLRVGKSQLKQIHQYRLYRNIIRCHNCLFCPKCGEKSVHFLHAFYFIYCKDCNRTARVSSPYYNSLLPYYMG